MNQHLLTHRSGLSQPSRLIAWKEVQSLVVADNLRKHLDTIAGVKFIHMQEVRLDTVVSPPVLESVLDLPQMSGHL